MSQYAYPALYGLFVWWFSTGVIVWLDNLPTRTFRWSFAGGTVIAAIALWRLGEGRNDVSVAGAYAAFTYAVLVWGWQEMAFFMGFVTGPRKTGCATACSLATRFRHGVAACLYHELAIIAAAAAILWLTWDAPNKVGMWTFMVLWSMRLSAKLNVFLGVRNLGESFLPAHLAYLKSFMARRPMNALFPVSVTAGTLIVAVLAQRAAADEATPFLAAGLTFLVTMLSLAIIEHWFLVLPLPLDALWSWWLRHRPAGETAHGPMTTADKLADSPPETMLQSPIYSPAQTAIAA